ncbi:hypothetical protein [Levilactobacillus fujinensis]|uniref:Uncharacterized protein n=1 Tax=Levilactobacillus fujinensis TaxID=2486024 RepID=A0ABW1TBR5_9LACO|nr:hypothetical protein [Levilactobacillus fujinensis]
MRWQNWLKISIIAIILGASGIFSSITASAKVKRTADVPDSARLTTQAAHYGYTFRGLKAQVNGQVGLQLSQRRSGVQFIYFLVKEGTTGAVASELTVKQGKKQLYQEILLWRPASGADEETGTLKTPQHTKWGVVWTELSPSNMGYYRHASASQLRQDYRATAGNAALVGQAIFQDAQLNENIKQAKQAHRQLFVFDKATTKSISQMTKSFDYLKKHRFDSTYAMNVYLKNKQRLNGLKIIM